MGTGINWGPISPSADLIMNPIYLKFSQLTFGDIVAADVKVSLRAAQASNASSELVAYLSWVLRVVNLVA